MTKQEKDKIERKKWLKTIKQLWKNPRGRSTIFFAGYIIFFAFIIITLRSNHQTNNKHKLDSIKQNVNINYKLDKIYQGNYYFSRIENLNGQITKFEGKSNDQKSEVLMMKGEQFTNFFMYNSIITQQVDGKYKVASDPYILGNLGIYRYINAILEQATFISKTDYNNGTSKYQYEISTTTLAKILDNIEIDIADIPNKIELEVQQDKNVVGIIYHVDAYASYLMQIPTNLNISLSFDRFGEVETLNVPSS